VQVETHTQFKKAGTMSLRGFSNALGVAVAALAVGWFGASVGGVLDDPKSVAGVWEGKLKLPTNKEIRLILKIEKGEKDAHKLVLDSPDEGLFDLALDPAEVKGDGIKLGIKLSRATIEGTLNADGTAIESTFKQGVSLPLKFARIDPANAPKAPVVVVPAELEGMWEGPLKVQAGMEIRLVLNVSKKTDGSFGAALDSPDQNASGLPITMLEFKEGVLKFESKPLRATFEGKLNAEKNSFEGTFTQGRKFPLTLKKTDKVATLPRPQNPKRPYPYEEEEVAYENAAANVKLAGTLTLPKGDGPFPAVLLITGSGAQDRDESLLGHKPFLVLSDYLTRRGLAVLRVDDRGVGGSTGDLAKSTSEDFAQDVLAGVTFLKKHPRIDGRKIGLCGHSEGGLIAPIVASRTEDVAFIVLMAGTGVPGSEIIKLQSYLIAKAMGTPESALRLSAELSEKMFAVLEQEPDDAKALQKMRELSEKTIAALSEEERKSLGEDGNSEAVSAQLSQVTNPWFRYFLTYDPRPTLAKVKCPVLAINGEKDLQVPPQQNLPEIEKAVRSGGNSHVTLVELAGHNHLFQHCESGAPSEYAKIEETLSPEALSAIGDWIDAQLKGL
jgi:pimeloyl-ACP methyl ester carboxylesterase